MVMFLSMILRKTIQATSKNDHKKSCLFKA
nr:MAG TPA: hypothetical protein [Caudoviricetes sp.]